MLRSRKSGREGKTAPRPLHFEMGDRQNQKNEDSNSTDSLQKEENVRIKREQPSRGKSKRRGERNHISLLESPDMEPITSAG